MCGVGSAQAARLELVPDCGDVLDADPVELDVLPVGDVGEVTAVRRRDVPNRSQLFDGELPAGDADAHHEVTVVELLRLEQAGLAATDARAPLGVETHPPHPTAQVGAVDRVEAGLRVDVENPALDVQGVVVLLHPLVGVERLAHAERPLALAARLAFIGVRSANPRLRAVRRGGWCRHAGRSFGSAGAGHAGCELKAAGRPRPDGGRRIRQPADRLRSTRAASRRAGAQQA